MEKIEEQLSDLIEEHMNRVKYNLTGVFSGLLWELKLDIEKEDPEFINAIGLLINHVIDTTYEDGPEGEEFPNWNRDDPKIKKIVSVLRKHLKKRGLGSRNIL